MVTTSTTAFLLLVSLCSALDEVRGGNSYFIPTSTIVIAQIRII
ncbi:unnamed protein product [Strongylus vulgaris]|uniref:Uncharacterized protein n=1 Tax=Strongylus vulgaris TaxID=40348 RepID=A0A3P7JJE2_STRVU|nr:unnamed protein product [Strongylus vulgaris]